MAAAAGIYVLTFIVLAAVCHASPPQIGACVSMCDIGSNHPCPDGYECQSNGCGHQCYRTTFVQPPGCPELEATCGQYCFLGLKRTDAGCEICECDHTAHRTP